MSFTQRNNDLEIENIHGVMPGDCFYLKYYNENVFFYVHKIKEEKVAVFELAKDKIKINGVTVNVLCRGLKPTQNPVVVPKYKNCTLSEFWLKTSDENGNIFLNVPIRYNSLIYNKVKKAGVDYPIIGTFSACYLKEETKKGLLNYYWEIQPIKKKKNKNKIKNYA